MLYLLLLLSLFSQSGFAANKIENVFDTIYEKGIWGRNEEGLGYSGSGSSLEEAKPYIEFLENFIKANEIKSVLDVGCGDWTFSRHIDWGDVEYTGLDVAKSVIERNQANFSAPNIRFYHFDGSFNNLPSAELLICKDVLQHLPIENVQQFLKNTKPFKHCLITNSYADIYSSDKNRSIALGDYTPIDLTKPPYKATGVKIYTYQSGEHIKQILYQGLR